MVSATDNFRPKDKTKKNDSSPSPTSPIVFIGLISLFLIGLIFVGNYFSKGKLFSKLKSNLKDSKKPLSDSNDESVTSDESPNAETDQ